MASSYLKGVRYWCRLKGHKEIGKWGSYPTPYRVGDENAKDFADRYAANAQKAIDKRLAVGSAATQSVADYAKDWLVERERNGIASVADDRGRLSNHIIPVLGDMRIREVRQKHVRDLVRALNRNPDMAPRTVLNVFGILRTMFRDIHGDELIERNPCEPPPPDLPTKVDKDPEWRDSATYTVEEVVSLISDPRVPPERRMQYALKALAGLRHGEAAGLRWRNWDPLSKPLSKLTIAHSYEKRTKTEVTRLVPVHPLLVRYLEAWRADHWERIYGRSPRADDFIVPTRRQTCVKANDAVRYFKDDLAALEFRLSAGEHRDRGGHDLRGWFITTCQEHGADTSAMMRITHTKPKDVIGGYTRLPWAALCNAVAKLQISVDGDPLMLAPDSATRERSVGLRWRNVATPTGFEPDKTTTSDHPEPVTGRDHTRLVTGCDLSLPLLVASLAPDPEDEP